MASPIPGGPQLRPTTRTPKLTYRTKSSDADSIQTVSTDVSGHTVFTRATSPSPSDCSMSSKPPASDGLSSDSSRAPSVAASSLSPRTMEKSLKNKSGFFSGLFSVKEPSAQAMADYQRHMMKLGALNSGRVNAVGMPGVSSAKLPPSVPKVNSRWDGVPQVVKEKEKRKEKAGRQSMHGTSRSVSTARSGGSETSSICTTHSRNAHSRGTLGGASMHSNGSGNYLAELYGWEVTDISSAASAKDFASVTSRPILSRNTSHQSAPPVVRTSKSASDTPESPKIPQTYLNQSPPRAPSSPAPPCHSYSPSTSSCDRSPVTPVQSSPLQSFNPSASTESSGDNLKTTIVEAPASVEEVIIRSSGANILGPPAAAKRRPKPSAPQGSEESPETWTENAGHASILKKEATSRNCSSPQRSPFKSYAVSPKPHQRLQRQKSTRDGLAMSFSLGDQAVPRWNSSDHNPENEENIERTITPTPEEGGLLRRKRMTLFKQ